MILKTTDTSSFHRVGVYVLHGRDLSDLAPEVFEVCSPCIYYSAKESSIFCREIFFLAENTKYQIHSWVMAYLKVPLLFLKLPDRDACSHSAPCSNNLRNRLTSQNIGRALLA